MTLLIGTSGWQYRDWRGRFYPGTLSQREWLAFYAARFQCVEVNNTFYSLPSRDAVAAWAASTPPDFVIGVKFSRYLTHMKRLREPEPSIALFFERIEPLGAKLGPVLLQLPPQLGPDHERLDQVLRAMPRGVRLAVEFRHPGWFEERTYEVLRAHNAALCLADRHSRPLTPLVRTAGWGYVRFHEGRAAPRPSYGRSALASWARRLASLWSADEDVFAFFNNDARAYAVRDARGLARPAARAGLAPSRVPAAEEIRAG